MIDIDLTAHLDSTTGLPTVDHRSPAQRRLDAIHDGPENHGATNPFSNFGSVGADTTNHTPNAAPTAAQSTTT